MIDITTIQLMKNTRDRLLEVGMKKETYDDLINRLIDFYLSINKEVSPGESNIKEKG